MTSGSKLWGASRTERISSALDLTDEQIDAIHDDLRRGRTEPGWPYGSATSINPLVVVLGASPGTSPQPGDRNYETRTPFDLPTVGEPHRHVLHYKDPRGFWNNRNSAVALLTLFQTAFASLGRFALTRPRVRSLRDLPPRRQRRAHPRCPPGE